MMHEAYPELETQRDFIGKMVRLEEERFANTVTVGLGKLRELLEKNDFLPEPDGPSPGIIDIRELARLYDTYGMPIDLMYVSLERSYPRIASKYGVEHWTLLQSSRSGNVVRLYTFDVPKPDYDEEEIIIGQNLPRVTEDVIGEKGFTYRRG